MSGQSLSIGLLAHSASQQRTLRSLVEDCGHRVATCLLISELAVAPDDCSPEPPDAWVLAMDSDPGESDGGNDGDQRLHRWLETQGAPVIFCDGDVPTTHQKHHADWARRLKEKINHLAGAINLARMETGSARQVWVLAASTGGPAAVKQFLAELPPDLGIGFIYVQHIDTGFKDTLAQVMSRNSHYPAHVAEHGSVVRPNEVAVVSPDYATELLPNGTFLVHPRPWSAPFSPSVDYIVANVAHSYGERSGVIVFSGMGNDGASSSRLMRQKGGLVWAQTPHSCTSDSMPTAVLATGCVGYAATPPRLAHELARLTKAQAGNGEALAPAPIARDIR